MSLSQDYSQVELSLVLLAQGLKVLARAIISSKSLGGNGEICFQTHMVVGRAQAPSLRLPQVAPLSMSQLSETGTQDGSHSQYL